jgi:hypothetical protein
MSELRASYRITLDGAESGLAFATPDALIIDRRGTGGELYVAHRGNRRIVVFDLTGQYLRQVRVRHP